MVNLPLPHDAQVLYAASCSRCGTLSVETDRDAATAVAAEHNVEHAPRHSCRYQEHAGWTGVEHCNGCVAERVLGYGYRAEKAS